MVSHVKGLLVQYGEAGRRYSEHIQESVALMGETREALIANGEKVAQACQRLQVKATGRVVGIAQVTEFGASTASEGAGHISSMEIPDFL